MSKLKKESQIYIDAVMSNISESLNADANIVNIYNSIGKAISEQGEKAFVAVLVKLISDKFENIKGFSARNLRRMRDFYNMYKENAELLIRAYELSWTQNSVILENCDSLEEIEFYLEVAKERNLSKVKILEVIDNKEFEKTEENKSEEIEVCATLYKIEAKPSMISVVEEIKTYLGSFVRLLKGGGLKHKMLRFYCKYDIIIIKEIY